MIRKVGVLGCGLMGAGIAQTAATAGYDVIVLELEPRFLNRGFAAIEKSLAKLAEKGSLPDSPDAIRARICGTTRREDLAECDLIIEAVIENSDEKKRMYQSLSGIAKPEAIFASNTSSVCITEMMASTGRPDRFLGLHFFNPVPLMALVEVVRTVATSPETHSTALAFVRKLGKTAVETRDLPGFIVNRLLVPYLLDAVRAFEEGVGSIADIDLAMKLGCGHPLGPLALLDFIGIDTTYYISQVLFDEFKEARFAAPPLLKRLVLAGWMGRKSGRGFYDWSNPQQPVPQDEPLRGLPAREAATPRESGEPIRSVA